MTRKNRECITFWVSVVGGCLGSGAQGWIDQARLAIDPDPSLPSYVHTRVKAPDPIRTPKLSILGPAQYYGGGPRGNRR